MDGVLLVLVLAAGDPASGAVAQAVAQAVQQQRHEARLVLPPDSAAQLQRRGLADADLVARTEKPLEATAKEPALVLVRVERRDAGKDHVVDVELWAGGRRTDGTAVSGPAGDPQAAAVDCACRLLREASLDPAAIAERRDAMLIASFADRGDWAGLVAAVAKRDDATPRLRHAAVMARLRLDDRAGAAAEFERLKAAAPDSPLTRDAAAALASDPAAPDALRDPATGDDGGKVLR